MELQEKNGQVGFRYRTCSGTCSSKALKALEPTEYAIWQTAPTVFMC